MTQQDTAHGNKQPSFRRGEYISFMKLFSMLGTRKMSMEELWKFYIDRKISRSSTSIRPDVFKKQIYKWNQGYARECRQVIQLQSMRCIPCHEKECNIQSFHRVCCDEMKRNYWMRPEMLSIIDDHLRSKFNVHHLHTHADDSIRSRTLDTLHNRLRIAKKRLANLEDTLRAIEHS